MHAIRFVACLIALIISAEARSSDNQTSETKQFITAKIHLQADPSIHNQISATVLLDNSDKTFVVQFSKPMDRATVENAFKQLNADDVKTKTLAYRFEWLSDSNCLLHLSKLQKCTLTIGFGGASGLKGGRMATRHDFSEKNANFQYLEIDIFPERQVLRKLDLNGRTIESYPIANETLYFDFMLDKGHYALARRILEEEEWNDQEFILLELSDGNTIRHPMPWADGFFNEAIKDPLTGGIVITSSTLLQYIDPNTIKNGGRGETLFRLKQPKSDYTLDLSAAFSPDGNRIAMALPVPVKYADENPTLTLMVFDRAGKVLNKITMPAHGVDREGVLLSFEINWQDSDHILATNDSSNLYRISLSDQRFEIIARDVMHPAVMGNYLFTPDSDLKYFRVLDLVTGKTIVDRVNIRLNKVFKIDDRKYLIGSSDDLHEHHKIYVFDLPTKGLKKIADGKLVDFIDGRMWVVNSPF